MTNLVLAAVLLVGHAERVIASTSETEPPTSVRETILFDEGWRFSLGNAADKEKDFGYCTGIPLAKAGAPSCGGGAVLADFDDSAWRTIDLPHDWAVELPFVAPNMPGHSSDRVVDHGYKPVGPYFPQTSIGWYRKAFTVSKNDEGRCIAIVFDGVFRDAEVWFNNHRIGRHEGGYTGFRFDLTNYVNYGGKNVLVVRVDATKYEGWFYEGAGIYRHVWLEKTNSLHIAPFGVKVVPTPDGDRAKVVASVQLVNDDSADRSGKVSFVVLDAEGECVARTSAPFETKSHATSEASVELTVHAPRLWSLDSPHLYRLVTEVMSDERQTDRVETSFGVRTIKFDPDLGFLLNGKRVQIKGACNHQDHAGVGSAVPDALLEWRVRQLKKWGFNAYRTSHHAPAPELSEICDRLGMLVLDENRLIGASPDVLSDLQYLVERDRNHPSVIAWSLGNEEIVQSTPQAARFGAVMKRLVHRLDGTRPVTYACNGGADARGIMNQTDLFGINYTRLGDFDAFHRDHPKWPMWSTEEASTLCTRGIYAQDRQRGYVGAYDVLTPDWGKTAEKWVKYYASRPWLAGAFVWTGFDYRGEPAPYAWPCINSHFGVLDTCGFPKDNAWYYKAWWTDKPVLHIFPHWNWPGKEGQEIDVRCFSNHEEVELLLNGRSLGRKPMPRLSHLAWKVKYALGTLSAKGYRHGKVVQQTEVATTGAPATLTVEPSEVIAKASGRDCVIVNVTVRDAQGRVVPTADAPVMFHVSPNARILGVGNGDPSCHEPDVLLPEISGRTTPKSESRADGGAKAWRRNSFNGCCQVIVAAPKQPGEFTIEAAASGLRSAILSLRAK